MGTDKKGEVFRTLLSYTERTIKEGSSPMSSINPVSPIKSSTKTGPNYMKYIPEIISLLKIIEGVGSYLDLERAMAGLGTGVRKKVITSFKNWAYAKGFGLKEALQKARWHPIHGMSRNQQIKFHDIPKNIFALAGAIESISVSKKLLYLSENVPILKKINTNPDSAEFFNRIVGFSEASGMDTLDFLSSLALEKDTDLDDSQVE